MAGKVRIGVIQVEKTGQREPSTMAERVAEPQSSPAWSPFHLAFNRQTLDYAHEKVSIASSGNVRTAEGREIDFSLKLKLEREDFSISNRKGEVVGGILLGPQNLI